MSGLGSNSARVRSKYQRRVPSRWKSVNPPSAKLSVLLSVGVGIFTLVTLVTYGLPQLLSMDFLHIPLVDLLAYLLVYSSIYMAAAIALLAVKNLAYPRLRTDYDLLLVTGVILGAELLSMLYANQPVVLLLSTFLCLGLLLLGKSIFNNYSYPGLNFYIAAFMSVTIVFAWSISFFVHMDVSFLTKFLMICSAPLLLVTLPSEIAQLFETYDIVCRDTWQRPQKPFPRRICTHHPMVSLHVPTYSEPSDLVIKTLDRLARLNYKNYEVIVIDNNTKDPALWKPVKAHCKKLGSKFRFMHVDNLAGAKGGALNYALERTVKKATIIGLIDADYQANKSFLRALIGYFDIPNMGFVQTPHDYRGWKGNLFLRMCYWEYKLFFHSGMISLSEKGAGITVGTMCLISKEALVNSGGWSDWCVTEDSELAIRIHDAGYDSVYVDKTYGRGIIPDTFEGYKKQRYRWTAGPIQEFQHHAKLFFGVSSQSSAFTMSQRVFHINHGYKNIVMSLRIPFLLVSLGVVVSMVIHQEVVAVPFELWLAATVTLLAEPLLTFLLYMSTVKPKVADLFLQIIPAKSLSHVLYHSAMRTTLSGSAAWNRTSKFASKESYASALLSTKEELTIGTLLMVFIILAYVLFPHAGISLMFLIGISYIALAYYAAPLMAVIGVWSLRGRQVRVTAKFPSSAAENPLSPIISAASASKELKG